MKKIQPVLFLLLMMSGISNAQEYEEILRNVFNEAEFWMVEDAYPDALILTPCDWDACALRPKTS